MSAPNDEYQPGTEGVEGAHTADTNQNDYKSRPGQSEIPVVGDDAKIEAGINEATADSDAQLGMHTFLFTTQLFVDKAIARDDSDAIDSNNIIDSRTRGAAKGVSYTEPGDEEGLPGPDDGTSAVRGGPN
jgi:hypothetical protein